MRERFPRSSPTTPVVRCVVLIMETHKGMNPFSSFSLWFLLPSPQSYGHGQAAPVLTFQCEVWGSLQDMTFTAVRGHLMELEFARPYKSVSVSSFPVSQHPLFLTMLHIFRSAHGAGALLLICSSRLRWRKLFAPTMSHCKKTWRSCHEGVM